MEKALLKRSQYMLGAIVSTISVVLLMVIFAAVTVAAVGQSEGRLHTGIAATLVGVIMLASGVRSSLQTADTVWTPSFRLVQVLAGLAVYVVIAVSQPESLTLLAGPLLSLVHWLFELPVFGWIARIAGAMFVLWSLIELFSFATVAIATPVALAARERN